MGEENLLEQTNDDVSKLNLPSPSLVVLSQESIDAGVCARYETFECLAKLDASALQDLQNKSYKLKQIHVSVEDIIYLLLFIQMCFLRTRSCSTVPG